MRGGGGDGREARHSALGPFMRTPPPPHEEEANAESQASD